MAESVDLKQIRQRVAVTYMKDGLFELYIGFPLTMIGLFELHQHYGGGAGFNAVYTPIIVFFPMFLFFIAKRKMTLPRVGYVNMKSDRFCFNKLHFILVIAAAVVVFALIYLLQVSQTVAGTEGAHKPYLGLYFSVFVAGVMSAMAVAAELPKMHLGSAFFIVVFGVLFLLKMYTGLGFVICGGGLLIVGTIMLTRFLRNNPRPSADDYEGPVTDG
jgi:hypothetical protein